MKIVRGWIYLAVVIFYGCDYHSFDNPENQDHGAALNDTLELKNYIPVEFPNHQVTIEMDSVINDSRCPVNAVCIWEGYGAVRFDFSVASQHTSFVLYTRPGILSGNNILVYGYRITLVELNPYPGGSMSVNQEEYSARISIKKE